MLNRHIILFFMVLLVGLSQCRRDPPVYSPPEVHSAPQDIIDYGYFKEGTYWVYEDSITKDIDSVYVTASYIGYDTITEEDNLGYTGVFQYFQTEMKSDLDGYTYKMWFNATWSGSVQGLPDRHKIFMNKTKPGDYVGEIILMEVPIVLGNELYWYGNNTITTKDFFSSYQLDTNYFDDVVKMNESVDQLQNDQESNYYIGKSIGIVRKEFKDSNQVWNLISFNIVQ